jgi:hypothetical protein
MGWRRGSHRWPVSAGRARRPCTGLTPPFQAAGNRVIALKPGLLCLMLGVCLKLLDLVTGHHGDPGTRRGHHGVAAGRQLFHVAPIMAAAKIKC